MLTFIVEYKRREKGRGEKKKMVIFIQKITISVMWYHYYLSLKIIQNK